MTNLPAAGGNASLVVYGEDKPGIVAAVAALLVRHEGNIVSLGQHSDNPVGDAFFQRTVIHFDDLSAVLPGLEADLADVVTGELKLRWRLRDLSQPVRVAILASKIDHCVLDLLWRQRRGELPINVSMVISNHSNLAEDVRFLGIPFIHVPSNRGDKSAQEAEILRLLTGNVDLVVLARYMQILSGSFIDAVGAPIINIHHSFLPAFVGASPYRQAENRGVKLVGATAHYVTEDLDEGPIIEQDVVRVSQEDTLEDLVRRGADVERQVLARAVLWHCEDRVIRHENRTILL
jgi:formyltetrahydrofolate deformylase